MSAVFDLLLDVVILSPGRRTRGPAPVAVLALALLAITTGGVVAVTWSPVAGVGRVAIGVIALLLVF